MSVSKSDEAVDKLHGLIEKMLVDVLPMELLLIAKAGILCPTCLKREACAHYSVIMTAWEAAKAIIERTGVVEGIEVPREMFDLSKDS